MIINNTPRVSRVTNERVQEEIQSIQKCLAFSPENLPLSEEQQRLVPKFMKVLDMANEESVEMDIAENPTNDRENYQIYTAWNDLKDGCTFRIGAEPFDDRLAFVRLEDVEKMLADCEHMSGDHVLAKYDIRFRETL